MKKLLTILLAGLIAATVVTGCAKKNETPNDDVNTDVQTPVEDETPAEDETPVEDETPAEDENNEEQPEVPEIPAQPETPAEDETQTDAPVVNETPAEDEPPAEDETPAQGGETTALSGKALGEIIELIYGIKTPEFMYGTMELDLTDLDGLKYFTGLSSADKIKEAAVSEAMIGAIPYSLVMVRVNDAADAQTVAQEMKDGIDQRKWVCVEADDMKVSGSGDVVMLIMISSLPDYAESITPAQVTEAFKEVCGGTLDFEL